MGVMIPQIARWVFFLLSVESQAINSSNSVLKGRLAEKTERELQGVTVMERS